MNAAELQEVILQVPNKLWTRAKMRKKFESLNWGEKEDDAIRIEKVGYWSLKVFQLLSLAKEVSSVYHKSVCLSKYSKVLGEAYQLEHLRRLATDAWLVLSMTWGRKYSKVVGEANQFELLRRLLFTTETCLSMIWGKRYSKIFDEASQFEPLRTLMTGKMFWYQKVKIWFVSFSYAFISGFLQQNECLVLQNEFALCVFSRSTLTPCDSCVSPAQTSPWIRWGRRPTSSRGSWCS